MTAEIILENLHFYAYHGCLPQERTVGGTYSMDVRLLLNDVHEAVENDQLDGTVNYAEVYELLKQEMKYPSALLEHVCGRILKRLFTDFQKIEEATIEICKETPPIGMDGGRCCVRLHEYRQTFEDGQMIHVYK